MKVTRIRNKEAFENALQGGRASVTHRPDGLIIMRKEGLYTSAQGGIKPIIGSARLEAEVFPDLMAQIEQAFQQGTLCIERTEPDYAIA